MYDPSLPQLYSRLQPWQRRIVRQKYIKQQANLCLHCKGNLNDKPLDSRPVNCNLFPKTFFEYSIHLHHDHKTDKTLGAVHAHCNAILWQFYGQ